MRKPGKAEKWAARSERLSAALRENLKRRKEQVRQRDLARDWRPAEDFTSETPRQGDTLGGGPDFRRNRSSE
jgi:hypothetical protein